MSFSFLFFFGGVGSWKAIWTGLRRAGKSAGAGHALRTGGLDSPGWGIPVSFFPVARLLSQTEPPQIVEITFQGAPMTIVIQLPSDSSDPYYSLLLNDVQHNSGMSGISQLVDSCLLPALSFSTALELGACFLQTRHAHPRST